MAVGKITNYKLTVDATGGIQNLDLDGGEPISVSLFTKGAGLHVLFTPTDSSDVADANDFLISDDENVIFELSRGVDRISVYNDAGSQAVLYIALSSV